MSRQIQSLLNAVQFMTLVPTPRTAQFDDDWLLSASKYFPLVGAGIGLVCGGVLLAGSLIWSGVVPAMMAVTAGAALTGALHEDGIADTADGLFGGRTREQRLALIKDSRLGLYGAVALVLSFAIRVAALASLPPWLGVATLVAGYSLGRTGIVAAMSALPYAGDAATGKLSYPTRAISRAGWFGLVAFSMLGALWLIMLDPPAAIVGLLAAGMFGLAAPWIALRLIGGYRGDVLGATEQMIQIGLLLGVVAMAGHG
ncbi:adenosylcobinamide-GDP ribazoletransferase [Rhodopseudomonas palustris]|uniref:adenosylcobinamide-GDP ribazoletransferase n=1 Tax=Rhodopseudomonas palustris TaxID=1076 RepID=UPI000641BACB|nr:adenosylcobinamide-GDP ribazoletransferase [Rhodopseudomonas palustris]